jgi:hypothetical protein
MNDKMAQMMRPLIDDVTQFADNPPGAADIESLSGSKLAKASLESVALRNVLSEVADGDLVQKLFDEPENAAQFMAKAAYTVNAIQGVRNQMISAISDEVSTKHIAASTVEGINNLKVKDLREHMLRYTGSYNMLMADGYYKNYNMSSADAFYESMPPDKKQKEIEFFKETMGQTPAAKTAAEPSKQPNREPIKLNVLLNEDKPHNSYNATATTRTNIDPAMYKISGKK